MDHLAVGLAGEPTRQILSAQHSLLAAGFCPSRSFPSLAAGAFFNTIDFRLVVGTLGPVSDTDTG
jgi:hypothetical protein